MQHLLYNIKEPVVCNQCLEEFSQGLSDAASLRDFLRMDIGFTDRGLQVWCQRHDANIVEINFNDDTAEADFRCLLPRAAQD